MNLAMRSVICTAILLNIVLPARGQGAFISAIHEYRPAPGQYINDTYTGTPEAAEKLKGGLSVPVSLGAFGGYIVAGFDHSIENDPGNPFGIDFTIFGNAFSGSAEPGIVSVMKDKNGNGLPDDTWYEIAGSQHYTQGILKEYRINYYNAGPGEEVYWRDGTGDSGIVSKNEFHTQPYYPSASLFPGVDTDSISFTGTRIFMPVSAENGILKTPGFLFGYADAHGVNAGISGDIPDNPYTPAIVEGTGGDAIDISWAVDTSGRFVNLDGIDFIRIQSGVNAYAPPLGEISTEVAGILDVSPNPAVTGETLLVSLENVPEILAVNSKIPVRPLLFDKGKPAEGEIRIFSSDSSVARITGGNDLWALDGGEFVLTAELVAKPSVRAEKKMKIIRPSSLDAGANFGFLFPGEKGTVKFTIKDQDGNIAGGLLPVVLVEDTTVAGITGIFRRQIEVTAAGEGNTTLFISVPGTDLQRSVNISVVGKTGAVGVSVSVKTGDENLVVRKNFMVSRTDIRPFTEKASSESMIPPGFVSLADAVAVVFLSNGFSGGGKVFRFRKDEYSGDRLYLWQVGNDWEFRYGWGGSQLEGAYRNCWVVSLNGKAYLNGFDEIAVKDGDVISVYHVEDILDGWEDFILYTGNDHHPGDREVNLFYSLSQYSLNESGGIEIQRGSLPEESGVFSNDLRIGTVGELSALEADALALTFDRAGIFDIRVEGFPGEVLQIEASDPSGNGYYERGVLRVFPNPFTDRINIAFDTRQKCLMVVTDLSGRILFKEQLNSSGSRDILTSGWPAGIYILHLQFPSGSENRVLIRQ